MNPRHLSYCPAWERNSEKQKHLHPELPRRTRKRRRSPRPWGGWTRNLTLGEACLKVHKELRGGRREWFIVLLSQPSENKHRGIKHPGDLQLKANYLSDGTFFENVLLLYYFLCLPLFLSVPTASRPDVHGVQGFFSSPMCNSCSGDPSTPSAGF